MEFKIFKLLFVKTNGYPGANVCMLNNYTLLLTLFLLELDKVQNYL